MKFAGADAGDVAGAKRRIVVKLSGRVFSEEGAETLAGYASFLARISRVCQPIIVAGGGRMARRYIGQARSLGADESTLDELGIDVSRLNARLLISALGARAHPLPPTTLREARLAADSGLVVVSGGLQPGQSTNGTAALIAERVGAGEFLNATDVDGVYDMDPNRHAGAKMFARIKVGDLRRLLVDEEISAGGYDLMDILALKIIERSRIRTRIMRADIKALDRAMRGRRPLPGTEVVLPGAAR